MSERVNASERTCEHACVHVCMCMCVCSLTHSLPKSFSTGRHCIDSLSQKEAWQARSVYLHTFAETLELATLPAGAKPRTPRHRSPGGGERRVDRKR